MNRCPQCGRGFPPTPWTDERVALLKKLWADGVPAEACAAELGNTTRNAVLGKVRRLGLRHRDRTGAFAEEGRAA